MKFPHLPQCNKEVSEETFLMSKHNDKNWQKFKEENQLNEEELIAGQSEESTDPESFDFDEPSYLALEEKLKIAEQTAQENWEKAVRAQAELDNVRRRAEREVANAHRYGLEKLLTSLLPIVDSLEQALQTAAKESNAAMLEGLELTMKLFTDVLQKFDVEQIDPLGDVFDPQLHEAMTIQEAPDAPPNSVLAVFQKGYKLNDRLIRPARVIVSKK